ncbi:DUF554 domain-containing protein [Candidatus Rhodoluna planktonica]|uniref:DUF554 domain-containing protein n=1 Tax=Candidatus Rhodoluna planktonica TaxID=535712 RepID=A0A1D9DXV9_9MICO|nr:DUF554 domain-containing protein [Candidatus Rhodoluna planktonica]AOY55648.1 hypothetical protein A4Z71_01160 [Candidatus Rhodoluna planktonica]
MVGTGTIINVLTIVIGAGLGVLLGSRFPEKTNRTVTDALGLITLVIGGLNLMSLNDKAFQQAVTPAGTLLVVIFAILFGGVAGSLLKIESRLETFGGWLQAKLSRKTNSSESRQRFINGFVDASLLFAIGPMAILGAMSDGMGQGANTLIVKAILDGFAAIAFASTLGWGVAFSAITVAIWEGGLTALAFFAKTGVPEALVSSITATGGILMLGIGLRLLKIRQVSVADLLPALIFAPVLTWLVGSFIL